MKLSKTQEEILKGIQGKLKHGDINAIAKKTGLTRQYVGMALKNNEIFHEDIVAAAVAIIAKREQSQKKLLQTIMTACY